MMKHTCTLILFFLGAILLSQETNEQKDLLKRAEENYKLVQTDPEAAFRESDKIIKEAKRSNNQDAELRAMVTRCLFYKNLNDFENMMVTAKSLFEKAEKYNNHTYQTIAKNYLFDAYNLNKLNDKALRELEQGLQIISKKKDEDSLSIVAKANIYISFANYFSSQNDSGSRLKYIKLSLREHEKFSDEKYKQELLFLDYSNLAAVYMDITPDSAKHYAGMSILNDKGYNNRDGVRFVNFSILGELAMKEGKYGDAISYFNEAEKVMDYKDPRNVEKLYQNIIETYNILKDDEKIRLYDAKRDSFRLKISENQNKYLHNLLEEKEKNNKIYIIYTLGIFCVSVLVLSFFVIRKNRVLAKQEKISQDYLEKITENQTGANYSKLLEMLKKNDPAFMVHFDETFPGFSSKLINLNPKISPSEIEFCALLKMKIPTKEIAKYKYIAPKTVQNKKHLIRKKLNIPNDIDIYQWFEDL